MSVLSDQQNNLLQGNDLSIFADLDVSYTISSRSWLSDMTLEQYLDRFFPYIHLQQVESLFGFADEASLLYGGRDVTRQTLLSSENIEQIYKAGSGLSLALTNHFFDEESYQKSYNLLAKHHRQGNSIVCENDLLAKRLKQDFPLYKLKASLIKNLNSYQKVVKALEIYDYVVIPMDLNDDDAFLQALPCKDRIILFANANCAYNCKSRICYKNISRKITGREEAKHACSKQVLPREQLGHLFFDIKKLRSFGFTHFKLVPSPASLQQEKKIRELDTVFADIINNYKQSAYIYSFPKSGRTWFRFILANYLNLYFNLGISIDLHSMFTLIPNDEPGSVKGVGGYKYVKDRRFPRIIASHKMPGCAGADAKIILLRQVYDVMVSDYFQQVHLLNTFSGSIGEFIRIENSSLQRYCNFINSIEDGEKDLIISYENMHDNIAGVIEKTLAHLNIPIEQEIIDKAVALSTFDKMKKTEQEKGLAGFSDKQYTSDAARVREGKVNNYCTHLSEADIEYIEVYCRQHLCERSKVLLRKVDIEQA